MQQMKEINFRKRPLQAIGFFFGLYVFLCFFGAFLVIGFQFIYWFVGGSNDYVSSSPLLSVADGELFAIYWYYVKTAFLNTPNWIWQGLVWFWNLL